MRNMCKFKVKKNSISKCGEKVDRTWLEEKLHLARNMAKNFFDQDNLNKYLKASVNNSVCIIDMSNSVGEYISQFYAGILMSSLGKESFSQTKIYGD